MLDDLKYIHQHDVSDALGLAEKQTEQYNYSFNFIWSEPKDIVNVVIAGMGGSGLAAKAFHSWPGLSVPFEVIQSYDLPSYVNNNSLFIASSYSGNTEETVNVLNVALSKDENSRPMIIVIAAGGKLEEVAVNNQLPFIKLPSGFQPRMTFGYQLRALCELFDQTKLTNNTVSQLQNAATGLKNEIAKWVSTVPTSNNDAKKLALEIIGKSPVVYAGNMLYPAAYKWKISFNENAKNVAWCNVLPEFNHNEMLGWTSHPIDKPYVVIELRSNLENERIQKRFAVSEKLLSGLRPQPHVINLPGDTILDQMIWAIALGDFVSLYVALLNGLDPTPVILIEKFKTALDQ